MRYFIPLSRMMVPRYQPPPFGPSTPQLGPPYVLSVFEGPLWVSEHPAISLIKDWLDWFVLGRGKRGGESMLEDLELVKNQVWWACRSRVSQLSQLSGCFSRSDVG